MMNRRALMLCSFLFTGVLGRLSIAKGTERKVLNIMPNDFGNLFAVSPDDEFVVLWNEKSSSWVESPKLGGISLTNRELTDYQDYKKDCEWLRQNLTRLEEKDGLRYKKWQERDKYWQERFSKILGFPDHKSFYRNWRISRQTFLYEFNEDLNAS